MPNRYGTKAHNIRIPDPVWERASELAKGEGTTVAAIVNAALTRYINRRKDQS